MKYVKRRTTVPVTTIAIAAIIASLPFRLLANLKRTPASVTLRRKIQTILTHFSNYGTEAPLHVNSLTAGLK